MTEENSDKKLEYKTNIIIALKTLCFCFICLALFLCSVFVLFPNTSAKISQVLGFKHIEGLSYQKIYQRSGKITDLYNVIIFEQEQKHYETELKYVDIMLERDDYGGFCDNLDKASIKNSTDKNLIAYTANSNAYFLSRKVICCYKLGKTIDNFVFGQLKNGKITEQSYATYVDLIFEDESLTSAEKQQKISQMIELEISGENLIDLLNLRINNINDKISIETDDNKKIILTYCLMRTYRANYFVYDVLGDDTKKEDNYNLYNTAKINLSSLIG